MIYKVTAIALFTMGTVCACDDQTPAQRIVPAYWDSTADAMPFDSVAYAHTLGWGDGPSFHVRFRSNGSAFYFGQGTSKRTGVWHGWVNVKDYGRLAHLIERLELTKLEGMRIQIMDVSLVKISIWLSGQREPIGMLYEKSVDKQPIEVWTFTRLMDRFIDEIAWYEPRLK